MPTADAILGVLPFSMRGTTTPIPRARPPNAQNTTAAGRFSRLFKHRNSRVLNADTTPTRAKVERVERSGVIEFETSYIQKRSTVLLLEHNFALAKTICRLDISGDRAASAASHLISFLRDNPQSQHHVEACITEAFADYTRDYAAATRNPRNLLRDNNLATMLVVCYLQQTCRAYLVSIMQPVMRAISPYVENCELDLLRLPPGTTTDTLDCNAFNLYTVCRAVLDAVFVAVKYAPPEMRRMCALIRHNIESQWDPPVATAARHDSMLNSYVLKPASCESPGRMKMKMKMQLELQPMLELREWETDLKSTVQTDIMSDISAALEERLEPPNSGSGKYEMFEKAVLGRVLTDKGSQESLVSSNRCSSIFTESSAEPTEPDTRKSIEDLVTSSFAELNKLDTSFPLGAKPKPQPGRAKRAKKHMSKRYSGSYFSPVETVISMLLFVRFFIPILTAPDTYGIDIELSPAHRRGLLLCAKVLAVLCNGVSFGSKEPCLSPMNGLIREYRPKLRRYLHSISSTSDASATTLSDADGHVSDDECSDNDSFTMDELASQFQAASVGAKVATNEERRKSKISLHRPKADTHELIPPVPAIPSGFLHAAAQVPKLTRTRSPTLIPSSSPPPTRSTIDIPGYRSSPIDPSASPNTPRVSEGGEAADNSMVSLDFLLCLEACMDKFDSKVYERAQNKEDLSAQHAVELFRELKPVMLYTKHLTSPSQPRHSSVFPIQPQEQLYPISKSATPASTLVPAMDSDDREDREDRGHRRTSTLPESYKFS